MPEAHWPRPNADDPALSVWATAQACARDQRTGRYLPASLRHPGKMLPALTAHAIACHTRPGDLVLDPMCGIGTTLTEAIHRHRHAIGIEIEAHWAFLARANARHATRHGATGRYRVHIGDARHLDQILDSCLHEQISLLLTSPPYGPSVHGQVDTTPHGVVKTDHHYGHQQANLAHTHNPSQLTDGLAHILATARPYLAADATVAITARPWRHARLGALCRPDGGDDRDAQFRCFRPLHGCVQEVRHHSRSSRESSAGTNCKGVIHESPEGTGEARPIPLARFPESRIPGQ
jgi:DNA methylase